MDFIDKRRIDVNLWLLKSRWIYILGLFVIGVLANSIGSYNFPYWLLLIILSIALVSNIVFRLTVRDVQSNTRDKRNKLFWVSVFQIIYDLVLFAVVFYYSGGLESVTAVFFCLPIMTAAILYGSFGGLVVALASGFLVALVVGLEMTGVIPHIYRYGQTSAFEYSSLSIASTKITATSFFYVIMGIFSGFTAKLLSSREYSLADKTARLEHVNQELDRKVGQLERSEQSIKKAFRDLKIERNKVEAIIANFIDPIIVIDKENGINLLNPAAYNMLGFTKHDIGKFISPDKDYSMENFRDLLEKRSEYSVEPIADENNNGLLSEKVVIKRRLGEVVFKVRTVKVTDDKGADIGVMKIFNDVTREQNLDRMKSEFISIAAHQLRTPLSSIKWVIKMVLSGDAGDLNEEQAELLDKGYKSNERMIGLVNDMLDVSRIEEGRFGYDFAVENFIETLDIIIETLSSQISEKHIKFKVDKPKKLPKVEMDKKKMSLVLQNLLENAVKYTPEYGRIEVILEPGEKFLRVRVKDNGVGIPAEDQAKLFSKFFRANNVIRMQTEGSGLGLFIVKNIIQKHGGDITFTSEEGKGTEFAFTLPFKAPENN